MKQLDILVEEPSVAEVLRIVLPKILPEGWMLNSNVFIRVHEGKRDLQDSIPRKLKAARQNRRLRGFVIVQDQDSNDCKVLKAKLTRICEDAIGTDLFIPCSVRIICHELESWYLGSMHAISIVCPRFKEEHYKNRSLFRNPDLCVNPKDELKRLIGDYGQITMAKSVAPYIDIANNKSQSFHAFIEGVNKVIKQLDLMGED